MSWALFQRAVRTSTAVFAGLGFVFLILPVLIIFPLSFSSGMFLDLSPSNLTTSWYQRMWDHPGYMTSFVNTLTVGALVCLLSVVFGTLAALAIARGQIRYGAVITAFLMSPLVMPQIVLAIGIFPVLAQINLIGSRFAVVLSHTAIATPLVLITVTASLRGYSPRMELAAMTLGANRWRTFVHITLPMIRIGMITGGVFAFALSFDEIVIALFLTDASSVTLPVFMWNELRYQMDPTIAAASTVAIILSLSLLGAVTFLQRMGSNKTRTK